MYSGTTPLGKQGQGGRGSPRLHGEARRLGHGYEAVELHAQPTVLPSCDNRFAMPLADLQMPAPFDTYHYTEKFAADRRAPRDWCDEFSSR